MRKLNVMKKILAGSMAMVMSMSLLVGCGTKKTADKIAEEDPNTCPSDTYEINWYLMADPQSDVHSVEEKINEYLKDKLNVTVNRRFSEKRKNYLVDKSVFHIQKRKNDIAYNNHRQKVRHNKYRLIGL